MMINNVNPNFFNYEKLKRKKFQNNEIIFDTYNILMQSKYSSKLDYYSFKRRLNHLFYTTIKNRCLLTNNSRSVYPFLKISKIPFSRKVFSLPGFYRSQW